MIQGRAAHLAAALAPRAALPTRRNANSAAPDLCAVEPELELAVKLDANGSFSSVAHWMPLS